MPDIREVLAALDPQDRVIWSQHRTEMRRSYLNAHNTTVGMVRWDHNDDAFLDLMDIKLALLFDRAGRFDTTKDIVGNDAQKIEADIVAANDKLAVNIPKEVMSIDKITTAATAMMQNGWAQQQELN